MNSKEKAYFLILVTLVLPVLIVVSLSLCIGFVLKSKLKKENIYGEDEESN